MRAATINKQKPKDLFLATATNPSAGLLCCTGFQTSARIPLPTRCFLAPLGRATFPPGEGILETFDILHFLLAFSQNCDKIRLHFLILRM